MHRAVKAAFLLQLATPVLAGCSNEVDRPAAALLDALSGIGLHKASYGTAKRIGEGFSVSKVKGVDDAGRPVTAEEIVAERAVSTGDGWRAANVIVTGLAADRLSARTIQLADVERTAASAVTTVGSYRGTDLRGRLQGQPFTAAEFSGAMRPDGNGEIAFRSLAVAGDVWNGRVRVASGQGPGTVAVSTQGLGSSQVQGDIVMVLSGITPREAMTYALSSEATAPPKGDLILASVEGTARSLPQGVAAPDPAGFRDPSMRALAEALRGMVASGVIGGGIRMAIPGGVALAGLGEAARAPDAYARLGVSLLTERMPADVVRKVVPQTSGRGTPEERGGGAAGPR